MSGSWRTRALCASVVVLPACFGTYVPPQDTEATTTVVDPSSTTSPATSSTSSGVDTSTSDATAGSSTTSGTTGFEACEHVDFLFVIDNGMDAGYNELLMTAIVSNATNIINTFGGLNSIHLGMTTTGSVPGNGGTCATAGSLIQPTPLPACPNQPFFDSVDDLPNLALCFGPTLLVPPPKGEASSPLTSIANALSPINYGPGGCNEGFHTPKDPLVIILFTNSDDELDTAESVFAGPVIFEEGLTPSALALVVIAGPIDECDGEGGDGGDPHSCGPEGLSLESACRIEEFSKLILDDQGLPEHTQFWNICEAQQDDSVFIEALEVGFAELIPRVCSG